ncbi:class I SAM-dependent methyltransferase [Aeoliella sp.]|uniref:class I SAM-dependent methyltransferase n=1 Tax=Aeoliella sp. TaxID=2795800 RepID=UPI003CCC1353
MSQPWPDYELLDFGDGRKLERFGELVFDRPSPQASGKRSLDAATWRAATAKFLGDKMGEGRWRKSTAGAPRPPRSIEVPLPNNRSFQITIDTLPTGQVGIFPEQLDNWQWIAERVARTGETCRVLNLFGYTGASTLAAAAAGAEVTHVDASKPAVMLARENAEKSGLVGAPIRWIVEDVLKYCRRELKRGSQYHGIVLDPPTYGHGPKSEEWRLVRDLPKLLEMCRELTQDAQQFVVATCHTPSVGPAELAAYLSDGLFGHCGQPPKSGRLQLATETNRQLESGVYARWPNNRSVTQ